MRRMRKKGLHYGLDFVMSHSNEEVEEVIKALAKKNRIARQEALKKASLEKLKRQLKKELNTAFGKAIEKEIGRRFSHLYRLRMKS